VELADIVRARGEHYERTHRLAVCQRRALAAIVRCRTAALGGHRRQCDACGAVRVVYNSCRNRHCPKCPTVAKERWLAARRDELLPVPYFHVVFTLPHELNLLAQMQPRPLYALLFRAAAQTLLAFADRHLGGPPAITVVLHTWGRNLSQHLHLHCLVSGGALRRDTQDWTPAPAGFLFPVRALARVFRARFLDGLRNLDDAPPGSADARAAQALHAGLRRKTWVVYCKPPIAGPEQVLEYLARYTHRIALSNDRIVSFDGQTVRFRWKDHRDGQVKILALEAEEFLRRFLLHVLPDRFVRIRHYGILGNRARRKLQLARERLGVAPQKPRPRESVAEIVRRLTGEDLDACPLCHVGRLRAVQVLPPEPRLRPTPTWDTS